MFFISLVESRMSELFCDTVFKVIRFDDNGTVRRKREIIIRHNLDTYAGAPYAFKVFGGGGKTDEILGCLLTSNAEHRCSRESRY